MRRRHLVAVGTVISLLVPAPAAAAAPRLSTTVIHGGLMHPWDVAFTPDGRMLVTERPGRIRVYASRWRNARLLSTKRVGNVRAEGEAGVMGIATKRSGDTQFVFVCASRTTPAGWRNQVLRYRLGRGGGLRFDRLVLGGMRANTYHNGCAVQIGPDGKLWVSMGDAGDLSLPQNRRSRNGKVLRVNLNGSVPSDNPFAGSPVYALGLRNPQGIAFAPGTGRAYSIEHGPDVHDEINRLRPGRNYGWPCWTGRSTRGPGASGCGSASGYAPPAWSSGTGGTLATSNGVFLTGRKWAAWRRNLLVATLKEQDLRRFESNDAGSRVYPRTPALFDARWGRLRSVVRPGANAAYVTTSNGDGNDRVIRIRAN